MKIRKLFFWSIIFFGVLLILSALITFSSKDVVIGDKVALVRIEGPILQSRDVVEELKGYTKDRSIKAVVVRVDSPGGGVVPSQEIYEQMKKTAAKKSVVVSMGSVAASGGYYISAPATKIVANPGTLTGSIGVIMEIPNIKGLMEKIGVKTEVVKSGRHKDIASVFRGIGPEERKILQGVMDDVHEQFIAAVSESRKISVEEVRDIADGSVFTGRQAKKLRLVDDIGDLQYAIKLAGSLAGIKGEPDVVMKKERHPIYDILGGRVSEGIIRLLPKMELKYLLPSA
ncbi:MAG: signal peptide peptidase SppA [Dissulfurispiraceae bacterium]|jgi:protease-4|nr:signal peptide peptidase SppA [Dissulfurispiraceae bacterium]